MQEPILYEQLLQAWISYAYDSYFIKYTNLLNLQPLFICTCEWFCAHGCQT